jgi:hypothetical protein
VARWVPGGNVSDNTSDNAATIISQVDESIVETDAADGAIAIADAAIDPVPVAPADPFALPPIPAGEETKITAERWAIVWPIYVEHAKAFRAATGDWPDRETDAKWCVGDAVPVTRGEVRIIRKAWQVKVGKRSRKKKTISLARPSQASYPSI